MTRTITDRDREVALRAATQVLSWHCARRGFDPVSMTDQDLTIVLADCFGIAGGCSRREIGGVTYPAIAFQGAGLKLWASWGTINVVQDRPVLSGSITLAVAQQVYGVADPEKPQQQLF